MMAHGGWTVGEKIPARGFYEKLHIEYMMNNLLTAHLPLLGSGSHPRDEQGW